MHAKQEEVGAAGAAVHWAQGWAEEQTPAATLSQKQAAAAGQAAQRCTGLCQRERLTALINLDGKRARRCAVQWQQAQQSIGRSGRHRAAGGANGGPAGGRVRHMILGQMGETCAGCSYCGRSVHSRGGGNGGGLRRRRHWRQLHWVKAAVTVRGLLVSMARQGGPEGPQARSSWTERRKGCVRSFGQDCRQFKHWNASLQAALIGQLLQGRSAHKCAQICRHGGGLTCRLLSCPR